MQYSLSFGNRKEFLSILDWLVMQQESVYLVMFVPRHQLILTGPGPPPLYCNCMELRSKPVTGVFAMDGESDFSGMNVIICAYLQRVDDSSLAD